MTLSSENKQALLIQLHTSIEETASINAKHILHGRLHQLIDYPPNGGLTEDEIATLEKLKDNKELSSALKKVLASSIASVLFDTLCIIDGVANPDTGNWTEVMLVDKLENIDNSTDFLHDDFFASYWNWKKKRRNMNRSLDNEL